MFIRTKDGIIGKVEDINYGKCYEIKLENENYSLSSSIRRSLTHLHNRGRPWHTICELASPNCLSQVWLKSLSKWHLRTYPPHKR